MKLKSAVNLAENKNLLNILSALGYPRKYAFV